MTNSVDKENKKSILVSYCGLYCPECPLYLGKISDMARDLRKELRNIQYDKFAKYISKLSKGKKLENFKECYDVLGAMMVFRCEGGCRQGGGTDNCQIRQCNQDKNLEGCWQCTKYEHCKKLDALNALHGNSHRKNLKNIKKHGINEFIKGNKGWYS
ncbi:DUF3795 domain-containing protein [Candidatus Bathyarchaeota archaeon]|nr:DUF3795 domain-containing protein [Candidatus Bathyarchaeota archaeon]